MYNSNTLQTKSLFIRILGFSFIFFFFFCTKDADEGEMANSETTPSSSSGDCANTTSVFSIKLDASTCNTDIEAQLGVNSKYKATISGNTRTVELNNIASHLVGEFPNAGNPNEIKAVTQQFTMPVTPSKADSPTYGTGWTTGVLLSGVVLEPYTAEFFGGRTEPNTDWNITALQSTTDLGLDCNNAHVQPTGIYHYHGTPSAYIEDLNADDNTKMTKVGYAADGYPIYYKYAYDDSEKIKTFESGWKLKTAVRGGDGSSAPDGCPDGLYFQDYEFVGGTGLDECNGRTGKTPDSESEYYYLITDNFPSLSLCFMGNPDNSFKH